MSKKYEFTGETKEFKRRILHRIKRIKDGLIGGWIESEENLSHKDSCFVYDEGMVYDDAKIFDDAVVFGNARVVDNARVYGNAMIYSNAEVCGNVRVCKGRIIGQISQPYKDIFQYKKYSQSNRSGSYAFIVTTQQIQNHISNHTKQNSIGNRIGNRHHDDCNECRYRFSIVI